LNGTICDDKNKLCKIFNTCSHGLCKNSQKGSYCESDNDCFLNKEKGMVCINKICRRKKYAGFDCINKEECYSDKCVNNICEGIEENLVCSPGI
jgi:hypothetical protein